MLASPTPSSLSAHPGDQDPGTLRDCPKLRIQSRPLSSGGQPKKVVPMPWVPFQSDLAGVSWGRYSVLVSSGARKWLQGSRLSSHSALPPPHPGLLLLFNHFVSSQRNECKLSDQRAALSCGQNPLPIYLTINVKDDVSNQDFRGNTSGW